VIDWLDFVAPLVLPSGQGSPLYAGEVISTTKNGLDIEWSKQKRMEHEGSHSSKISVSHGDALGGYPGIRISGCPGKFLQGHNIFGSDDIVGLTLEMLHRVCASLHLVPTETEQGFWDLGLINMLRVDVTQSRDLGTLPRVLTAIRSLSETANLKFRGRGEFNGHSLLYGKGSRHFSTTLYAKGAELKVKGHRLHLLLQETSLPSVAEGLLRIEHRLMGMFLRKKELHILANWGENTPAELHSELLSGLEIADATMIDTGKLAGLPAALRTSYVLWTTGVDLRTVISRRTFYRHRSLLKQSHGIDIAIPQPADAPSNVVPLKVVLHAMPFPDAPHWAVGTPLYFEPSRRLKRA
jgi:II/X family phage/plasmid replication protein